MDLNVTFLDPVLAANATSTPEWAKFSPTYYLVEHFLTLFYAVHPYRTMHKSTDDVPNFYNMAVRIAPLVIVVEWILMKLRGMPTHRTNDLLYGLGALTIGAIPQIWLEDRVFKLFTYLYDNYRVVDLPHDSMWTWLLCVLLVDLSMYVTHKLSHAVHFLWASHQFHHSTEYHNLLGAARNGVTDKFYLALFNIPWAFILPTGCLKAHHQLNYTYQIYIHTSTIPSLGWVEYIFNTPRTHYYHHAVNRFCIDKNFAGFLNIWDVIFGTMVCPWDHENEKVYHGILEPVRSWDIIWVYLHTYRDIIVRVFNFKNWGDKLGAIFKGPGWDPGKPWCGYLEEIPEVPPDEKKIPYNKPSGWDAVIYCGIHAAITFLLTNVAVGLHRAMPTPHLVLAYGFCVWGIANLGYILEHKWFAPHLEWTRVALFFVVEWILSDYLAPFGGVVAFVKWWYAFSVVALPFQFGRFSKGLKNKAE